VKLIFQYAAARGGVRDDEGRMPRFLNNFLQKTQTYVSESIPTKLKNNKLVQKNPLFYELTILLSEVTQNKISYPAAKLKNVRPENYEKETSEIFFQLLPILVQIQTIWNDPAKINTGARKNFIEILKEQFGNLQKISKDSGIYNPENPQPISDVFGKLADDDPQKLRLLKLADKIAKREIDAQLDESGLQKEIAAATEKLIGNLTANLQIRENETLEKRIPEIKNKIDSLLLKLKDYFTNGPEINEENCFDTIGNLIRDFENEKENLEKEKSKWFIFKKTKENIETKIGAINLQISNLEQLSADLDNLIHKKDICKKRKTELENILEKVSEKPDLKKLIAEIKTAILKLKDKSKLEDLGYSKMNHKIKEYKAKKDGISTAEKITTETFVRIAEEFLKENSDF
jgi:hypothetical protein